MANYTTTLLVLAVMIMGFALFVRGGEVLTALAVSTTNSTITTVNLTNTAPGCINMTCYDEDGTTDYIDLVGGDQRYARCEANCWDFNGWATVKNATGQLSTGGASGCSANNVNCYVNATCWNTTINATHANVRCGFWMWFNADNTSKTGTWLGKINIGDWGGLQSSNAVDGINVSEMLALGVNSALNFGARNAGSNDSTAAVAHPIFNYGNIEMDFQANGSSPGMTCTSGSFAADYIRCNLTNGGFYQASYGLSSSLSGPNTGGKFEINVTENNTITTEVPVAPYVDSYWGIGVSSGVSGNCQGSIWFAAVRS